MIPDEAVEAAARADVAYLEIDWDTPIWQGSAEDQEGFRQGYLNSNRAALTAAAPILREQTLREVRAALRTAYAQLDQEGHQGAAEVVGDAMSDLMDELGGHEDGLPTGPGRWLDRCPTEWWLGPEPAPGRHHRCTVIDWHHAGDHICECGATMGPPFLQPKDGQSAVTWTEVADALGVTEDDLRQELHRLGLPKPITDDGSMAKIAERIDRTVADMQMASAALGGDPDEDVALMVGTLTAEEIASVEHIADTHFDVPELYLTEEAE
jgi:hypothetical protein